MVLVATCRTSIAVSLIVQVIPHAFLRACPACAGIRDWFPRRGHRRNCQGWEQDGPWLVASPVAARRGHSTLARASRRMRRHAMELVLLWILAHCRTPLRGR